MFGLDFVKMMDDNRLVSLFNSDSPPKYGTLNKKFTGDQKNNIFKEIYWIDLDRYSWEIYLYGLGLYFMI